MGRWPSGFDPRGGARAAAIALVLGAATVRAPSAAPLRAAASDIVVGLEAPAPTVATVTQDGVTWRVVSAAGFTTTDRPGYPELPVRRVLIGIPATGAPRITVTTTVTRSLGAGGRVRPVPSFAPIDAGAAQSTAAGPRSILAPDPIAYHDDGWYPSAPAGVVEEGWLRDQRVLRLELRPYRYRPSDGALVWIESLRVDVRFDGAPGGGGDAGDRDDVRVVGGDGGAVKAADRVVGGRAAVAVPAGDPFDSVLRGVLFNADQAAAWRTGRGPAAFAPEPPAAFVGSVVDVAVRGAGMVRLTGASLAAAGWPIDAVAADRVALLDGGREVAIRFDGALDGRLDPADAIVFYGMASTSRYSADHIYQLVQQDHAGRRMARSRRPPTGLAAADAVTATVHHEDDAVYVSDLPRDWTAAHRAFDSSVDRWYGPLLSAPAAVTVTLPAPLPAPGRRAVHVRVAAVGKTSDGARDGDHLLEVRVNGRAAPPWRFDGNDRRVVAEMTVAGASLAGGAVDVALEAPGDQGAPLDQLYIDWIELEYAREPLADGDHLAFRADGDGGDVVIDGFSAPPDVYDVTDADAPRLVVDAVASTGALGRGLRFGPPSDAPGDVPDASPTTSANASPARAIRAYEAVAPHGLAEPAALTVRFPSSPIAGPGADYVVLAPPGFQVAAARLAEYRRGQGHHVRVVDVTAVYGAYAGGVPEPEAIRRFLVDAYRRWDRPPLYVLLLGDGTSDPRGNVPGGAANLIPVPLSVADPWLGEVPTDNAYALVSGDDAMPDLAVGRLPAGTAAEAEALVDKIIAYESAPLSGDWRRRLMFVADVPDDAGEFDALSDGIAASHVPATYRIDKVYYKRTHKDRDGARGAILTGLGQGALVTNYIGHGRTVSWGADGLLRRADAAALTNGPRLPIALDMTCMTGRFSEPLSRSLAEEAVRNPSGGVIAAFSPTGFGVATGHDLLDGMFLDALLDLGLQPLGAAALASKAKLYAASTRDRDLLDTYVLLGDPGLRVALPAGSAAEAPPTGVPSVAPTNEPTNERTADPTATSGSSTPPAAATVSPTPARTAAGGGASTPSPTASRGPGATPSPPGDRQPMATTIPSTSSWADGTLLLPWVGRAAR